MEASLANIAIRISAGKHDIGDSRRRSARSLTVSSFSETGPTEAVSDDCESFPTSVKESLSSSTPLSGDVDEDESDPDPLDSLCLRRERNMVFAMLIQDDWVYSEMLGR